MPVAGQPLAANVARVMQALDIIGTPLPAALVVPGATALARSLSPDGELPSLLAERTAPPGGARAWVCVGRTCKLPADAVDTRRAQLASLVRR